MAAEQGGLGHHGKFVLRNAEGRPIGVGRQHVAQRDHALRTGRGTTRDAEHELEHRPAVDQPRLHQIQAMLDLTHVETLQLRLDAQFLSPPRHPGQIPGPVDHHAVPPEVHRAAVDGADLRQQLHDVAEALLRADEVRAGAILVGILVRAMEHAAHAGGEVEDDVRLVVADNLHDPAEQVRLAGADARLRIAHVDVDDGRASLGGGDGVGGDLLGGHRDVRAAAHRVPSAGQRASNGDWLHGVVRADVSSP